MAQAKGPKRKLHPEQEQKEQPGKEARIVGASIFVPPGRGDKLASKVDGCVLPGAEWAKLIPVQQWTVYRDALEAVRSTGLPFLLGGGFGLAAYIGHWRNTKDIDLYILPRFRDALAQALEKAGFVDYHSELPYDCGWIYRCTRDGVIVDLIWSMANRRATMDESWFEHAPSLTIHDETFKVLPAEELLWCKLYVLQRDHCDWPDVFNLLYAAGPGLDWDRLLGRIGGDFLLLQSALLVLNWLCPNRAARLPEKIRARFQLPASPPVSIEEEKRRVRLIDSRAWFAAFLPADVPLEV